jgi:hypothetical protein
LRTSFKRSYGRRYSGVPSSSRNFWLVDPVPSSGRQPSSGRHLWLVDPGTAAGEITPPPRISQTRTSATRLTQERGETRAIARARAELAVDLHQDSYFSEWRIGTSKLAATKTPAEVLQQLADLGFAWRDIARLVKVSVPAIQKWRQGQGMSGRSGHEWGAPGKACRAPCSLQDAD